MKTSWQNVHQWYDKKVGDEGHDFHRHVILPKLLPRLSKGSIVDLACGQGVLGRKIAPDTLYTGYDIAPSFVKIAKDSDKSRLHNYHTQDCSKPIDSTKKYEHAVCILAAQNIEHLEGLVLNAKSLLSKGGKFHLVLNHPCYRVPRQTSWGEDKDKKIQYRRIDRYMSSLKIPIQTHPGKGEKSPETWSFHHSLTDFLKPFFQTGFMMSNLEEWVSHKVSTGAKAKMEDRAREEIPMFLYLELTLV